MNKIGVLGLWTILLLSCSRYTGALEEALLASGNNREELEQVLMHYKDDSLKWKAACFLIENMPGKGTIEYSFSLADSTYTRLDPNSDLSVITADYLIENIDLAFEVWRRYPWCKQLSFDEFCREILPYRVRQEPLDRWRSFYYLRYRKIIDSLAETGATRKDVVFFMNSHYGKKYLHEAADVPGDFSIEQIEKLGGGTCDHLALNAVQQMRAIGIPLNLDALPYHGRVNGGHTYNSFTDERGGFLYFSPYEREPERNRWIAPLVQRVCYDLQPVDEIAPNQWNRMLEYRSLRNVTSDYYETRSIQLPANDTVIYLATYNRGDFKVVAQAKAKKGLVIYPAVTCGLLYFQMKGDKQKLLPCGDPFISTKDSLHFINPTGDIVTLNGIKTYDVKRVLKLGKERYTLYYWNDGWQPIKEAVSADSCTLDFGEVPMRSLYLIYGNTYMGRMQRPFLMDDGELVFY